MSIADTMNVYLAGKIAQGDWRHAIVPGLRDAIHNEAPTDGWETIPFSVPGEKPSSERERGLHYVGPFFIACDHGCAHGRSNHGYAASNQNVMCGDNMWSEWGKPHDDKTYIAREETFDRCLAAIRSCDLFFVWLDQRDAYGTLVEAGIAHTLGKRVYIVSPHTFDHDDFWFAGQMCVGGSIRQDHNPMDALSCAVREMRSYERTRRAAS